MEKNGSGFYENASFLKKTKTTPTNNQQEDSNGAYENLNMTRQNSDGAVYENTKARYGPGDQLYVNGQVADNLSTGSKASGIYENYGNSEQLYEHPNQRNTYRDDIEYTCLKPIAQPNRVGNETPPADQVLFNPLAASIFDICISLSVCPFFVCLFLSSCMFPPTSSYIPYYSRRLRSAYMRPSSQRGLNAIQS